MAHGKKTGSATPTGTNSSTDNPRGLGRLPVEDAQAGSTLGFPELQAGDAQFVVRQGRTEQSLAAAHARPADRHANPGRSKEAESWQHRQNEPEKLASADNYGQYQDTQATRQGEHEQSRVASAIPQVAEETAPEWAHAAQRPRRFTTPCASSERRRRERGRRWHCARGPRPKCASG